MSIGEIAGLIAAIAFAVLVGFLCLNLSKFAKVVEKVEETVKRMNTTIDVVTKDVDNLSVEVEGLLNKTNTLVDDVNRKLGKTDPLFTAIGDLGVTVSDLNDSATDMVENLAAGVSRAKVFTGTKKKRKRRPSTFSQLAGAVYRGVTKPASDMSDEELADQYNVESAAEAKEEVVKETVEEAVWVDDEVIKAEMEEVAEESPKQQSRLADEMAKNISQASRTAGRVIIKK